MFLRTETGSASVLAGATVLALIWANISYSSYEKFWATRLAVSVGSSGLTLDLREFVNSGLMALFFLVVGLEARREFDVGELRARSRLTLPLLVGLTGMAVPIVIYLAANAGQPAMHGWGMAMSTDTAFALGALALVGRRLPDRVRIYLLTFSVVDDLAGLAVIAIAYSGSIDAVPLLAGLALIGMVLILRARGVRSGVFYLIVGIACWVAFLKSGVDPVVVGLVFGLLTYAYPAPRESLEQASEAFRSFREQPTAELAQSARNVVRTAVSPNDQLEQLYHPWTSYLIVPLFALANAGIVLNAGFLASAYTSPVTLGIVAGYLVGKPLGTSGCAWLVTKLSHGRVRPPVGWGAVVGAGTVAGIGFTVSLLIASLALRGDTLAEAKLGILSAAVAASVLTWIVFRLVNRLPVRARLRALLGTAEVITDLAVPVDPERDHIRGPEESLVTMVEYGDFECPYCGMAEPAVRELLRDYGEVRYVWRHLPLNDVHPNAQLAAEAAEAAAKQGAFWEMHDLLLDHQDALQPRDLIGYADSLGLDTRQFAASLRKHAGMAHVSEDVESADLSNVSGTPTFFINGKRHYGAYDIETLKKAVKLAKARAYISALPAVLPPHPHAGGGRERLTMDTRRRFRVNAQPTAAAAGTIDVGGDLTVNRLGFGAMRITGPGIWGDPPSRDQAIATLRQVVELGVNFIDTADSYGPEVSETLIAEALYPYPDNLVIATKGGLVRPGPSRWDADGRPAHLREACEGSLRRLRLEQIPLYQFHRPDPAVPLAESIGAIAELKNEGKIRHVGISNVTESQLREAQRIVPIVSVQNRYNASDRRSESLIDLCEQEQLVFLPWAPVQEAGQNPAVANAAERHGVTQHQVVLAWLLARSPQILPIPGTGSPRHAEENIDAASIELTPEDVEAISKGA